jgi:hypothetical protein
MFCLSSNTTRIEIDYHSIIATRVKPEHPANPSQLARFEKHLYNYLHARGYTAPNPQSDFE